MSSPGTSFSARAAASPHHALGASSAMDISSSATTTRASSSVFPPPWMWFPSYLRFAESVIERIEIREGTADLIIHFDHAFRLEVIPFSSGYESWQITAPDRSNI